MTQENMSMEEALLQLCEYDMSIERLKREMGNLPQIDKIKTCRKSRKALKAKQDQVIELTDDVEEKLSKLQKEEQSVLEKIAELQQSIDTNTDYRVTQKLTRDMQGQIKRHGSIGKEQDDLLERQIKIDKIGADVADKLAKVDSVEDRLTAALKKEGGALQRQIEELIYERLVIIKTFDPKLARRYEQKRKEKNGIAVSYLDMNKCSVCRTQFPNGDLRKLQSGPTISECPNCGRIIIVAKVEDE